MLSVLILPDISYAKNNPYKIEINKRTNHLYLYKNNQVIETYRVGTGATQELTPEGIFTIGSKRKNPAWRDPETGKIVPRGHKDNPLGKYWLGLKIHANDPAQTYGIHGTNNESSVPGHVSKGCIRMKNADIRELFVDYNIQIGTPVWIHSGVSNHSWLNSGSQQESVKPASLEIVTTARVNIREGLSTSTRAIVVVDKNTTLKVTGESTNWYRVQLSNGRIGYVFKAYAQIATGKDSTLQPNPNPLPHSAPYTSQNPESEQKLSVTFNTAFTKEGSLKISASLPNVKKASGTWKVAINGKTVATQDGTEPTNTLIVKNPDLDAQSLRINVTFDGTVDGKKQNGQTEHVYKKTEQKLKLTPNFQNNQLRIKASLQKYQKANGIWIIQLGETKRVVLQSGENLDETFDEVTFNKNHFPIKVEFKGFTKELFVTATYQKKLKVKLPDQNKDDQEQNKDKSKSKDNKINLNGEEDDDEDEKESTDEQNNDANDDGQSNNENGTVEDNDHNDDEDGDENEEENKEQTSNKRGGKLPKTASNYPLGIMIGLVILLIGTITLQRLRLRKER